MDSLIKNITKELIKKAHDGAIPVENLIRGALSLAEKVGDRDFATWARQELDGYDSTQETPAYRTILEDSWGLDGDDPRLRRALDFRDSVPLRVPLADVAAFVSKYPEDSYLLVGAGNPKCETNSGKELLPEARWPRGIEGTYWVPCRCRALKGILEEVRKEAREWCWKLASRAEPDQHRSTDNLATSKNFMRRRGVDWEIRFQGGEVFTERDKKGLQYVAILLRREGEDVSAVELASGSDGTTADVPDGLGGRDDLALSQPVVDEKYRVNVEAEVGRINAQLERPELSQDERLKLMDEKERIEHCIKGDIGLLWKSRAFVDPSERARKAVRSAISDAIKAIKNPPFRKHLAAFISTGKSCAYRPQKKEKWTIIGTR